MCLVDSCIIKIQFEYATHIFILINSFGFLLFIIFNRLSFLFAVPVTANHDSRGGGDAEPGRDPGRVCRHCQRGSGGGQPGAGLWIGELYTLFQYLSMNSNHSLNFLCFKISCLKK